MPRWFIWASIVAATVALLPFAWIARTRAVRSSTPRIHLMTDMDNQPRFESQQANPLFADGRAMRPPVAGTVARAGLREDDGFFRGRTGEDWVSRLPLDVDDELLSRGRERYDVFCSPCHGLDGYGGGMVSLRAEELQEALWVPPTSFHGDLVRSRPVGHLFNTITNGIRTMPAYGSRIPERDRWAIVAYVRALQRSQAASVEDVPPDLRSSLR